MSSSLAGWYVSKRLEDRVEFVQQKVQLLRRFESFLLEKISIKSIIKFLSNDMQRGYSKRRRSPADLFHSALMKFNGVDPQSFRDVVQLILGWREYRNVHDANREQWGMPPEWLGGQGDGWTWKADSVGGVISKIVELIREGD